VDGDAAQVVSRDLDFAGVDPCADPEVEVARGPAEGDGAAQGTFRRIECREDAIACRLDETSPLPIDRRSRAVPGRS